MNIFKRLLNVLVLLCVLLGAYGVYSSIDEYSRRDVAREISCRIKEALVKRASEMTKDVADEFNMSDLIKNRRVNCETPVDIGASVELLASLLGLIIVGALNYTLFGKITLWNRFSGSEQTEKPK